MAGAVAVAVVEVQTTAAATYPSLLPNTSIVISPANGPRPAAVVVAVVVVVVVDDREARTKNPAVEATRDPRRHRSSSTRRWRITGVVVPPLVQPSRQNKQHLLLRPLLKSPPRQHRLVTTTST